MPSLLLWAHAQVMHSSGGHPPEQRQRAALAPAVGMAGTPEPGDALCLGQPAKKRGTKVNPYQPDQGSAHGATLGRRGPSQRPIPGSYRRVLDCYVPSPGRRGLLRTSDGPRLRGWRARTQAGRRTAVMSLWATTAVPRYREQTGRPTSLREPPVGLKRLLP